MVPATVSESHPLLVEDYPHCVIYAGTAEQLVMAGLVRLDQLPGQPGRGKTCATYSGDQPVSKGVRVRRDEKYVQVMRQGKDKFRVHVGRSESEVRIREEAVELAAARQQAAAEQAERFRIAKESAERQLQSMPATPEAYRRDRLDYASFHLEMIERSLFARGRSYHGDGGYSYDETSIRAIRALTERVRVLLRNGGTVFDVKLNDARIDEIHAMAAQFAPTRPALRVVGVAGQKRSMS